MRRDSSTPQAFPAGATPFQIAKGLSRPFDAISDRHKPPLDIPAGLRAQVFDEGLYLATIRDDVFEIVPPDGFTPRAFGLHEA